MAGLTVCHGSISSHVMSDYRSARYLLEAGIRCAAENVFINAEGIEDKVFAEKIVSEVKGYIADGVAVKA
jgi:formiminotetrahydrofolate cyclodeaminase